MNKRESFTGNLGFILATAGSAIGLGNLWRFPYLAAKNGGGIFLFIYIILVLSFGYTLMTAEIAIGRKTGAGVLQAYKRMDKRFGFLGWIALAVPAIVFPYYCVIGGWIVHYGAAYISGSANKIYKMGANDFFTHFISSSLSPLLCLLVFMGISTFIVVLGVKKGIEKASKLIMPILFLLIIGIAIYSFTLSHYDETAKEVRTAQEGLKIYFIPNFKGMTVGKFFSILLDATGQMFYSLSVAMGIMITYGSYTKKESDLISSINRIEIFDTSIAILAGMIIIPTVFVFQGSEGLATSGPSLMFVSLPAVFEQMGSIGHVIGALFFLLVFFAALTSSVSLLEAVTSSIIDRFHLTRQAAVLLCLAVSFAIGTVVCLGYNVLYYDIPLFNGTHGQILDLLDYLTNSLMLPVVAFLTCILVGWICKPHYVLDEIKIGHKSESLHRGKLFIVMIKFVAPLLLIIILLQAFNVFAFLE